VEGKFSVFDAAQVYGVRRRMESIFWCALLDAFSASELTESQFARAVGLKANTFYKQMREIRAGGRMCLRASMLAPILECRDRRLVPTDLREKAFVALLTTNPTPKELHRLGAWTDPELLALCQLENWSALPSWLRDSNAEQWTAPALAHGKALVANDAEHGGTRGELVGRKAVSRQRKRAN